MLTHLALFLAVSLVIVVMGAFYSQPLDGPALRSVPRRYAVFVLSCAAVAAVMLILELVFVD